MNVCDQIFYQYAIYTYNSTKRCGHHRNQQRDFHPIRRAKAQQTMIHDRYEQIRLNEYDENSVSNKQSRSFVLQPWNLYNIAKGFKWGKQ
jgi:hypothetical protein